MTPRVAALDALMRTKPAADAGKHVRCPMPGLVVSILVEAGQEVSAGTPLAIVEAMKMENILRAERDATVAAIKREAGRRARRRRGDPRTGVGGRDGPRLLAPTACFSTY